MDLLISKKCDARMPNFEHRVCVACDTQRKYDNNNRRHHTRTNVANLLYYVAQQCWHCFLFCFVWDLVMNAWLSYTVVQIQLFFVILFALVYGWCTVCVFMSSSITTFCYHFHFLFSNIGIYLLYSNCQGTASLIYVNYTKTWCSSCDRIKRKQGLGSARESH